jgi:asparagine synthase (glutamine-hydrolysing)
MGRAARSRLPTEAARRSHQQLTDGLAAARLVGHDLTAEHAGVEWRFPFLDRRLVEFVLGMPTACRFRDGATKVILREAMRGILPETVRTRRNFVHFTDLLARGLRETERAKIGALISESRVVDRGYLTRRQLESAWLACQQGSDFGSFRSLVGALAAEAWLLHQERAGNGTGPASRNVAGLALAG